MEWAPHLEKGEKILWEGCPAPTCFCFRGWRQALWALPWLAVAGGLRMLGWVSPWSAGGMILCLGAACCFFPGRFLWARLQWGTVFYAFTDRALLVAGGLVRSKVIRFPHSRLERVAAEWQGPNLATLTVFGQDGSRVVLWCLEHPEKVMALLERRPGRDRDD